MDRALYKLLSADDPAVFQVRESDLPEVSRGEHAFSVDPVGNFGYLADVAYLREQRDHAMRRAAGYEAAARHVETMQTVDPVGDLAAQIEEDRHVDQ